MSNFFSFFDLIKNEVISLLEICPVYITTALVACGTFSLILACKRAIVG